MNKDQIINALKTVHDPDLHKDLISLGMIEDIEIDGSKSGIFGPFFGSVFVGILHFSECQAAFLWCPEYLIFLLEKEDEVVAFDHILYLLTINGFIPFVN